MLDLFSPRDWMHMGGFRPSGAWAQRYFARKRPEIFKHNIIFPKTVVSLKQVYVGPPIKSKWGPKHVTVDYPVTR